MRLIAVLLHSATVIIRHPLLESIEYLFYHILALISFLSLDKYKFPTKWVSYWVSQGTTERSGKLEISLKYNKTLRFLEKKTNVQLKKKVLAEESEYNTYLSIKLIVDGAAVYKIQLTKVLNS